MFTLVGSTDGGSARRHDFHTAHWLCALRIFFLNASDVGGRFANLGAF